MKAKLLFSFLLVLLTVSVWGQQITEQLAKERVLQFLNENGAAKARGLSASMVSAKVEAQSIYAFNLEGGGYIIASSDSRALPVLGYSDKGTIDWDRMPDNMRYWLKQYDQAMATLGKNKTFRDGNSIFAKATTRAERQAVAPLIKTEWYQGEPYWDKCPLYDGADYTQTGKPCPTGCVATAMAQVMNYWQWPKSSPEIPAYDQPTAFQGKEKIWTHPALPAVTFDWANMIENYEKKNPMTGNWEVVGTDVEKDAVATLMQYCGQSIYMDYHPDGCSSWGSYVAEALAKYFCYDAGVRLAPRHTCLVAQYASLGTLAAGIDGQNCQLSSIFVKYVYSELVYAGTLAGTRNTADTNADAFTAVRKAFLDNLLGNLMVFGQSAFNQGNCLSQNRGIPLQYSFDIIRSCQLATHKTAATQIWIPA